MTNAALLVGVNKYQNGNDLRGCCNDVDNSKKILVDILGYPSGEIVVLKDKDATKANIVTELYKMIGKLTDGDFGFFHFSGHGSQVADADGDEADGKDELICPHDMDWGKKLYLTDDELSDILATVSHDAWVEVMLDSCHSGTATRVFDGRQTKTIESPHVDLDLPVRRMVRSVRKVGNHVLWSGCADNQYSSDAYINGTYNGAFTYYWAKNMHTNKRALRHKLLQQVRKDLLKNGFDQTPQLTISARG